MTFQTKMPVATMTFAAMLLAAPAMAATFTPVDLSDWVAQPLDGSKKRISAHNPAAWSLGAGNDSVTQTVNSLPSVFTEGSDSSGKVIRGTLGVFQTAGQFNDDDFIGFVFGYDDGEIGSATADFWIIDWKQGSQTLTEGQTGGATLAQREAEAGLRLSHVKGDLSASSPATEMDFWSHTGVVSEVAKGATLGDTGWADATSYDFELSYSSTRLIFSIDGVEQFDIVDDFGTGGFGFYGMSQQNARYAALEIAPVPVPASLPLLLAGAVGLGAVARRRRAQSS